jgi:hypothetical protein
MKKGAYSIRQILLFIWKKKAHIWFNYVKYLLLKKQFNSLKTLKVIF